MSSYVFNAILNLLKVNNKDNKTTWISFSGLFTLNFKQIQDNIEQLNVFVFTFKFEQVFPCEA